MGLGDGVCDRDLPGVFVGLNDTVGDTVGVSLGAIPVSEKHSKEPDGHNDVPLA